MRPPGRCPMPRKQTRALRRRGGRVRRALAALAISVLSASMLSTLPAHADDGTSASAPNSSGDPEAAPASPPSQTTSTLEGGDGPSVAQDEAMAQASAQARATGKPVAVNALTTETWQVIAQPHGGFSFSANPIPVRTRQHGTWVPVNTTLRKNPDGTYTPAATAYGT